MLGGARAGRIWTGISLATVVGYFALDATGHTPVSEVPAEWLRVLRLVVTFGIVALIALLAWLYESNKDRMLATVQAANVALAHARDEAQSAHREARLVLDHVAQGLLVADRKGRRVGEQSRFATQLFGDAVTTAHVADLFIAHDPKFAAMLSLGWEAVFEDVLPLELTLDQLPRSCRFGERTLAFQYVPVLAEGAHERILIVITDETLEVEAREIERKHREQLDVFRWIVKDGDYFVTAFDELDALARSLAGDAIAWDERLRLLHTLKGNASLFGLTTLARHCHELEDQIRDGLQKAMTQEQRLELFEVWRSTRALVEPLLGGFQGDRVTVSRGEYHELLAEVANRDQRLHARLLAWSWEPGRAHLERLQKKAKAIAARLPCRDVRVVMEDDGTRLPADLSPFWSTAVHLIRNALDHGIEDPDDRRAAGKPELGRLSLRARTEATCVSIEIEDDGRGIDWDRVKAKALELGLPASDQRDLQRALFADGLSTRSEATELSGRGVGMAAVLMSCLSLGGTIEVHSTRGVGTRIRLTVPIAHQEIAA
jgi:two-component system, chemotaxis family, sensor kinase CheA